MSNSKKNKAYACFYVLYVNGMDNYKGLPSENHNFYLLLWKRFGHKNVAISVVCRACFPVFTERPCNLQAEHQKLYFSTFFPHSLLFAAVFDFGIECD